MTAPMPRRCDASPRRARIAGKFSGIAGAPFAFSALFVLLVSGGCRNRENATSEGPSGNASSAGSAGASASSSSSAAADLSPHFSEKADASKGPFAGLEHPRGIAAGATGRIWIADFGHAAVRVFDSNGGLLGGWGGVGEGQYGMKDPCGIAVQGDNVYVADTWRTGVERFSTAGEFRGKAAADLYGPRGVAVAPDGRVYISDTGNNRLVVCDADLTNTRPIGKGGAGTDEFAGPMGVAVGPTGTVYVADSGNQRIQVIDSQGRFQAHWKFNGWGANAEPYLDVDRDGSVYVSDPNGQAVVRFDRDGKETKRWTTDGDGKKFLRPTGIAVDRKNRVLFVVNTDANTIARIPLGK